MEVKLNKSFLSSIVLLLGLFWGKFYCVGWSVGCGDWVVRWVVWGWPWEPRPGDGPWEPRPGWAVGADDGLREPGRRGRWAVEAVFRVNRRVPLLAAIGILIPVLLTDLGPEMALPIL